MKCVVPHLALLLSIMRSGRIAQSPARDSQTTKRPTAAAQRPANILLDSLVCDASGCIGPRERHNAVGGGCGALLEGPQQGPAPEVDRYLLGSIAGLGRRVCAESEQSCMKAVIERRGFPRLKKMLYHSQKKSYHVRALNCGPNCHHVNTRPCRHIWYDDGTIRAKAVRGRMRWVFRGQISWKVGPRRGPDSPYVRET